MGPRCGAYNEAGSHLKILSSAFVSSRQTAYTRFHKRGGKGTRCDTYGEADTHMGPGERVIGAHVTSRDAARVQEAVFALQEMDAERTSFLQTEVSSTQDFTDRMKEQWTIYMEETENNYREDSTTVESEKMVIEEGLQECKSMATSGLQQWETAQSSLLTHGQNNKSSMESLLKSGIEANELIHCRSSASMNTAIEDLDIEHKGLLSCIDSSLKLDHKTCEKIDSLIVPCHAELRELQIGHQHSTMKITENAENCLKKEYMVDKKTCLTPKRRPINVPSVAFIEGLRTPAVEELLKSWEAKPAIGGEGKQYLGAQETQVQALQGDCRAPLTIKN
ncbi:hypothetical protein IEQ34_022142 [Dendrobium chrysotoxum]|uniref:Uncharacterized protein n=1 Tax=Dendrobium chrysotoxum TaxID=161865 RepID=A0AAV7FY71_DENCH|nr:hypothetical protein IEQ34_022142 [Dendrobium chrysotoxum]